MPLRKQAAAPGQARRKAARARPGAALVEPSGPDVAQAPPGREGPPSPPEPVDEAAVAEIFRRFRALDPDPRGELDFINPYTLLVAVVLSAQATDRSVNLATRPLFALADTPGKMLALGESAVREHIRTIGLFNTKAKNVIALSAILEREHGGVVPRDREIMRALPGVGRKTASVVANIAFGEPAIAVDTHIFRVANRIPLVVAPTPDRVQDGLERIVPDEFRLGAHHWLILHGRYVCKARKPECWRCPIRDLCRFEPKTPGPARATPLPEE
jgi:endonuclease-3